MVRRGALKFLFTAALAAPTLLGLACVSRGPEVFVPLQKTAKAQYQYALDSEARNQLVLRNPGQMDRLERARETVRQAFMRVSEYFPEDREVTPLARLKLAEIKCGIEIPAYKPSNGELKSAIKDFEALQAGYPENDFVQAKSKFDQGVCLKNLKDYERAQQLFKDVEDLYGESKDEGIKRIVHYARQFYQQTYVK